VLTALDLANTFENLTPGAEAAIVLLAQPAV